MCGALHVSMCSVCCQRIRDYPSGSKPRMNGLDAMWRNNRGKHVEMVGVPLARRAAF
jgi:hypothetical protein